MMADLVARGNAPITGDLVQLGPGLWCADSPGAGELSPQGVVISAGVTDRFDQAVGQGWFVLAIGQSPHGLLTDAQARRLSRLGGRVMSVGAAGCDVTTTDTTYADWVAQTGAPFAIIRPDFYVAATATTQAGLRDHFDTLTRQLGLV
ncbi:MAG: bifunctional 3-(3-hydroxy-phenyl)propionate/3-hydroxycinnamic acid hydroxylase, partial [Pseudomonadota bacterium]